MSMNILKPIKRFWRGLTARMRVALAILLAAAILLAGFGVYLLVRPTANAEEGTRSLFPGVDRAGIKSVRCHTVHGTEYTVKGAYYTVTDTYGNPQTNKRFYIVTSDGTDHSGLSLNSMQLSYFVVGTGKNYVYSPVISAPEPGTEGYSEALAAYESKRKELGFHENSAYYELTSEEGNVYRVYYGIKDVTGDGYYVQLAGDNTVYSTKSAFVGDLLQKEGPETLIESTLLYPAQNGYAYAFPYSYAIRDYVRVKEAGTVVTADHYAVGYTLKDEDGKLLAGSLPLQSFTGESEPARLYREAVSAFFVGRELGECKEEFTFTYPDTEQMGDLRGDTVKIFVETVDYVTEATLRFDVKYLPALDRELSQKLCAYAYTAPSDITSYIPDSDALLTMLENTMKLSGTVVKLGLDDDVLTKYGLYRHQIWLAYPYAAEFHVNDPRFDYDADDTSEEKEEKDALREQAFFADRENFIDGRLYVSDVTENGTRYVASILYDLVVEVDAATLSFMDKTAIELVDDFMITAQSTDVVSFQMFWNYGKGEFLSDAYDFKVTVEEVVTGNSGLVDGAGNPIGGQTTKEITKVVATPVGGGKELVLDPDTYYGLYTRLTYTHYRGEHGLSDAELDALLGDDAKCVLRLVQTLSDGVTNYWEFYPVSANRVVVLVKNGSGASPGARFVIWGTAFRDITNGYLHLMKGEAFDYDQRYE